MKLDIYCVYVLIYLNFWARMTVRVAFACRSIDHLFIYISCKQIDQTQQYRHVSIKFKQNQRKCVRARVRGVEIERNREWKIKMQFFFYSFSFFFVLHLEVYVENLGVFFLCWSENNFKTFQLFMHDVGTHCLCVVNVDMSHRFDFACSLLQICFVFGLFISPKHSNYQASGLSAFFCCTQIDVVIDIAL